MRMDEYIGQYRRHPEAKAADANGNPAGPETRGVLGRLAVRSVRLARVGKEIDRLDEAEGASLEGDGPKEFERESLAEDIAVLATLPQESAAREIGITARRWRDLVKGKSQPRGATAESIACVAGGYRLSSSAEAGSAKRARPLAKRRRRRGRSV